MKHSVPWRTLLLLSLSLFWCEGPSASLHAANSAKTGNAPATDAASTTPAHSPGLRPPAQTGSLKHLLPGGGGTLSFIENRGQFDPDVKFQAKSGSKVLWFTNTGVVFDVERPVADSQPATDPGAAATRGPTLPMFQRRGVSEPTTHSRKLERLVFSEKFANGRESPKIEPSAAQPGIYNYFIGNDPKNWRTGVVRYSQIVYRDVWPGIDIRFVVKGMDIEQEFLVRPGADTSLIRIGYSGVQGLHVDADGSLVVQTLFGPLRESSPRIYQDIGGRRTSVPGHYRIAGEFAYAFQLGACSAGHPLVIDPTLLYSTYAGGTGTDVGNGIAVDAGGNAYVAGYSLGAGGYPTTPGAIQATCPATSCGQTSVIVSKFDPLGRLSYSTYLGGPAGGNVARGIAVDTNGEAYLTGIASPGFPTAPNGYQFGSCAYGSSFMAKLNSAGTALLYSACYVDDAEGAEFYGAGANAIAVDGGGRAYLTGSTANPFLATTSGAVQKALSGGNNAFLLIVDPSLTGTASLVYSTYLGGEVNDIGRAIAVDAYGNAYITGNTFSSHFPVTPNAFQTTDKQFNCGLGSGNGQCPTAFVAKVNPSVYGATGLIYSSYLGGNVGSSGYNSSKGDYGYAIAIDSSGNAYVAGSTSSPNFPTTPGAFQTSTNCSVASGFVTKVNAAGGALVYSTFVSGNSQAGGGTCSTPLSGIALDSSNNAYVVGETSSLGLPVTPNAFQNINHGQNAFLTELAASGSSLIYSTYFGGSGQDSAAGVAVDATGDAYATGNTTSRDFPVTSFAFQPAFGGGLNCGNFPCPDVFATKFPLGAPGALSITGILPNTPGGNAGTVTREIVGSGFHAGATVQLNCGGQSIVGANVSIGAGGRILNATFNLAAASPGTCNVIVTNPDNTSATLPQAFTVQQGGAPNVLISLTGVARREAPPELPVSPTNAAWFITVSNAGNIDSSGSLIWQAPNPPFTLTSATPAGVVNLEQTSSDFDVWVSGPIASGTSQRYTSTATTTAPITAGPPITAQACISPIVGTDWRQWGQCVANVAILAGTCLSVAACVGLGALTDGALATATTLCTAAALACIGSGYNAFYKNALANCFNSANIPGPTPICISAPTFYIAPSDPNSLVGPSGVGGQRWTSGVQALTYGISFGNEPTATAPAQQVVVTQPLGTNVNLSTLTLPGITVPNGGSTIQVTAPPSFNPAVGVNEFTTNVDLRPTQSLLVAVDAKLNPGTQTLTWTLTSIDPTTGLPPLNPLIGFLPPGAGANVAFSVTPTPGLATGAEVTQQATIVFQGASPMSTVPWTNTIDNTPPVSHVTVLPTPSTCSSFRVSWSGSDVGSGLAGFTVYVSDTGGPFTAWVSNTTAASADYTGVVGHTYSFYSIATDLTGNVENGKTLAEASTAVTAAGPCGPPSLSGQSSNVAQSGATVTLNLQLTNTGFTAAQAVNINQITTRTLSGTGTVTLASPSLPATEGPLAIGASTTVTVTLNVPTTVTRFSLTESGNLLDGAGNSYNYSIAQTIIP